ncbi:MAG: hypothetical protein ABEL51_00515 [Salinibacter sp.]
MAHAFFLGVDVDPHDAESPPDVTHTLFEKSTEGTDDEATYRLDHIRHHSDISSADDLADHLQGLVAEQPYIGRTSLVINGTTDFGRTLVEALQDRGLDPVVVTLTEGAGVAAGDADEMGIHMGGIDAVRTIADLHRDARLTFESHATETASRLARDVQALAERLDEADGDLEALGVSTSGPSYDAEATHVNSAALAVWLGSERSFDPSQHLKESPQTDSLRGA